MAISQEALRTSSTTAPATRGISEVWSSLLLEQNGSTDRTCVGIFRIRLKPSSETIGAKDVGAFSAGTSRLMIAPERPMADSAGIDDFEFVLHEVRAGWQTCFDISSSGCVRSGKGVGPTRKRLNGNTPVDRRIGMSYTIQADCKRVVGGGRDVGGGRVTANENDVGHGEGGLNPRCRSCVKREMICIRVCC